MEREEAVRSQMTETCIVSQVEVRPKADNTTIPQTIDMIDQINKEREVSSDHSRLTVSEEKPQTH